MNRLIILVIIFFYRSVLVFGQSQPGYEKTVIFSGWTADKGQIIFHLSIKGERASNGTITFVPGGDSEKAKEMNLYLLGKGSPFAEWKGIKMSVEAPEHRTPTEVMYLLFDMDRLYLSDAKKHIITVLDWQYEGPVDGRGTACTTCLDKKEAYQAFQRYFINE